MALWLSYFSRSCLIACLSGSCIFLITRYPNHLDLRVHVSLSGSKKGEHVTSPINFPTSLRIASFCFYFFKKGVKTPNSFLLRLLFFPCVVSWKLLHQMTPYHKKANRRAWNRPSSQTYLRPVGLQIPLLMSFHQQMVLMLFSRNFFRHKLCPCFRKAVSGHYGPSFVRHQRPAQMHRDQNQIHPHLQKIHGQIFSHPSWAHQWFQIWNNPFWPLSLQKFETFEPSIPSRAEEGCSLDSMEISYEHLQSGWSGHSESTQGCSCSKSPTSSDASWWTPQYRDFQPVHGP